MTSGIGVCDQLNMISRADPTKCTNHKHAVTGILLRTKLASNLVDRSLVLTLYNQSGLTLLMGNVLHCHYLAPALPQKPVR